MSGPDDQPSGNPARFMARLGAGLAAFGVFTCGWLAMRSDDWRQMVLYTLLAIGAAMVGMTLSRQAR
jgi:hypothetical protein